MSIYKVFRVIDNIISEGYVYLGNNDIVEGNLPITRNIMAGKFSVNIKIIKSKVRGAVIVQYQNCKI